MTTATSRFATVSAAPPDPILGLTDAFNADPRPTKLNLSVGVYKDAAGKTPVLASVKAAEAKLLAGETTKGYLGIDGLADYRHHVYDMIFGDDVPADRVSVAQTPGGTAAVRVAAEFLADQCPGAKVWMSNPTWANHGAIFRRAGLEPGTYRYLNADKTGLDFAAMMDDLRTGPSAGDAVLLHACCHNPTGVDPTAGQWLQIADLMAQRGLLPLLDFAYQGFGDSLEQDAAGLRTVVRTCGEAMVASSYSKNFGLYSERVGALSMVVRDAGESDAVASQVKRLIRGNYSNPPRHGGAIVAAILDDGELRRQWMSELDDMRGRITRLRGGFIDAMHAAAPGSDYEFLRPQKGMFSYSGLTPMQVDRLKSEHGIYIVGSGRINVAGIDESRLQWLAKAVASVL